MKTNEQIAREATVKITNGVLSKWPEEKTAKMEDGATDSATLVMDKKTAHTIVAALKEYENSFYTGDHGGRLRMAGAQYIRQTIEDAMKNEWPE